MKSKRNVSNAEGMTNSCYPPQCPELRRPDRAHTKTAASIRVVFPRQKRRFLTRARTLLATGRAGSTRVLPARQLPVEAPSGKQNGRRTDYEYRNEIHFRRALSYP